MKENDKRAAPRIPYVSEVVCEGAGTRLIARTNDLSATGVFIHSQLCCEAGTILKLKFAVTSTEIETLGEVCYCMPQIGMGVRFLGLQPEYRSAIERLIESRTHGESKNLNAQGRSTIASGVEPVDKVLGGLDRGHLYLAQGDASGKSLFGREFLIEGLKSGQTAALITQYSTEDAVRRFARLGYDCVPDVRGGRLVIFEYPQDIAEQVARQQHLAPLLQGLERILDEHSPERVVFDPINNLLAGDEQDSTAARAREFAVWIRSFRATVVLVADGECKEVIESLTPLVRESIRFGVRESSDRVVRYVSFEKSPSVPDQPVRVDPSRGISLLEGPQPIEPGDSGQLDLNADRPPTAAVSEETHEAFFAMLDELQSFASSLDPELPETDNHCPPA